MATYRARPFLPVAAAFAGAARWLRFSACALALGATVVSAQTVVTGISPASGQLPDALIETFYSVTISADTVPPGTPVSWSSDAFCLSGSGLRFVLPDGQTTSTTIQGAGSAPGTYQCTVTATIPSVVS